MQYHCFLAFYKYFLINIKRHNLKVLTLKLFQNKIQHLKFLEYLHIKFQDDKNSYYLKDLFILLIHNIFQIINSFILDNKINLYYKKHHRYQNQVKLNFKNILQPLYNFLKLNNYFLFISIIKFFQLFRYLLINYFNILQYFIHFISLFNDYLNQLFIIDLIKFIHFISLFND